MDRPSPKLIVFDVDGTLVDSQNIIVHCMSQAFREARLPVPAREDVLRLVGLPAEIMAARLAPGTDEAGALALADLYRKAYFHARQQPEHGEGLFPGVHEMLADLAAGGFLLGIATGKARRGLNAVLERHGLSAFFVTFQTGDIPPAKPHPAMLLRAIAEAGVEAHETLMVGDTSYDMEMARAAKAIPLGVSWGYHDRAELIAAGAVDILTTWADLPRLVLDGNGAETWPNLASIGGGGPTG